MLTLILYFLLSFIMFSCNSSIENIDDAHNTAINDEVNVAFSLFETYTQKLGFLAQAFGYIESCEKLNINDDIELKFNDTLMLGSIYACSVTKNFKSVTGLKCDSVFTYKFFFDKTNMLDYELLDFLNDYSDSIIYLKFNEQEIYRDTLRKTIIIFDPPHSKSNLEGCY